MRTDVDGSVVGELHVHFLAAFLKDFELAAFGQQHAPLGAEELVTVIDVVRAGKAVPPMARHEHEKTEVAIEIVT